MTYVDTFPHPTDTGTLYRQFYLRKELLASPVGLQFVDVLHKDALVLEDVTLGPEVQTVVPGGQKDTFSGRRNVEINPGGQKSQYKCNSIYIIHTGSYLKQIPAKSCD